MVLPCLLSAQTTSMAVTVFLLACSVYVTASLTIPSKNPFKTCLVSSQTKDEILLTPPLLANLLIAGLVIPSMDAFALLFVLILLVPTFPFPPTPFPPLPCPAIFVYQIIIQSCPLQYIQIYNNPLLQNLKSDWINIILLFRCFFNPVIIHILFFYQKSLSNRNIFVNRGYMAGVLMISRLIFSEKLYNFTIKKF